MVEQPKTIQDNAAQEHEDSQKNRIKATFSLLDHAVKIYNNTETYVKRGLTLFGLGTIIAGASFGAGQRLPNDKAIVSPNSFDTPANNVANNSTPQNPVNHSPQSNHSQPQIIYLTPPPSQSITVPNSQPVANPPAVEQQPEPVANPPAVDSLPVSGELAQVKQTIESVQEISGTVANIKQDIIPLFEGEKD